MVTRFYEYVQRHPRLVIASFLAALAIIYGNLPHALLFLLLAGVIPGTNLVLPPGVMLLGIAAIIWIICLEATYATRRSL